MQVIKPKRIVFPYGEYITIRMWNVDDMQDFLNSTEEHNPIEFDKDFIDRIDRFEIDIERK